MAEAHKADPQQNPAQQASQAIADAGAEAEKMQLDTPGPGHHYVVNGVKVNAWGEAIDSPEAKKRL